MEDDNFNIDHDAWSYQEYEYHDYDYDVCCWDPRYQGEPGQCSCEEYHKAMAKHYRLGNIWLIRFDRAVDLFNYYRWKIVYEIKKKFKNPTTSGPLHPDDLPF